MALQVNLFPLNPWSEVKVKVVVMRSQTDAFIGHCEDVFCFVDAEGSAVSDLGCSVSGVLSGEDCFQA